MSRIMMTKPRGGGIVSVGESQLEHFLSIGYKVVEDEPQSYDKEITTDKVQEIIAAINTLDVDKDFGKSTGKPHVSSIEKVLGYNISSKDRDNAWKSISG